MVRADFDRSLEELEAELMGLGEMVEKAVIKSMDALERRDLAVAYEVVAEDDLIDEKRFELEEKCIDLIATQQPLAVDLRTLLAVLHIAVELERVGDYAEGIGKICLIIGDDEPVETPPQLSQMASMGIAMLRRSLKSLMDPIATLAIEELMRELSEDYSIIIVTHNMQQAARVSHYTAFLMVEEARVGFLVEFGESRQIFTNPEDERTEAYITGRFG